MVGADKSVGRLAAKVPLKRATATTSERITVARMDGWLGTELLL
jgi:hypothetical protein